MSGVGRFWPAAWHCARNASCVAGNRCGSPSNWFQRLAMGARRAWRSACSSGGSGWRNTCTRPARSRGAPSRYGCGSHPARRIRLPGPRIARGPASRAAAIAARVERARDGFPIVAVQVRRHGAGLRHHRPRSPASSARLRSTPSDSRIARHRPAPRGGREWPRPARWRRRRRPRRARRRARRAGARARRSCGSGRPGWRAPATLLLEGGAAHVQRQWRIGVAVVDIGGDGGQLRLQRSRIRVQRRIGKGGGQLGAQRPSAPSRIAQMPSSVLPARTMPSVVWPMARIGPCGALPGAR